MLSWRDQGHPEAGGAEAFLDHVAAGTWPAGATTSPCVTALYPGRRRGRDPRRPRFLRRGGRFSVYPLGLLTLLRHRRSVDVVVDVQNGIPFWSPLVTRRPVVNLVHHVHREQWPEVFGPVRARFGWWLESRVATRVYSPRAAPRGVRRDPGRARRPRCRLRPARRSSTAAATRSWHRCTTECSDEPSLVVLGRLVPHKRVELALQAVAVLRHRHPGIVLHVVGHGYWHDELVACAERLGVSDAVRFHGFVPDEVKNALLASAWVNLLPSLKEGWGLAIVEAGALGVPSVAFREASGTTESVLDGRTGYLVDDLAGLVAATEALLVDPVLRKELGEAAREFAEGFSWEATGAAVEALLRSVVAGRPAGLGAVVGDQRLGDRVRRLGGARGHDRD